MKKCCRCKEERDDGSFYKDKRAKDGLNSSCKKCIDQINREWRKENPESAILKSRKSHERHREKEREYAKNYAKRLREKDYEKYKENKDKWDKENPEKVKIINKKARKKFYSKEENYKKLYAACCKWSKDNPEKLKEYRKKAAQLSRIKFPEKNAARKMVSAAITLRLLIRPTNCSRCLKECKPEGHHQDYSKPLEVIWLCKTCHIKEHKK